MKKLILFISLTFAFSASFAGTKGPDFTFGSLANRCIYNNKLYKIKTNTRQMYVDEKNQGLIVNLSGFCKDISCIFYEILHNENFKKEKKNPKNYFESYFNINYFNRYYYPLKVEVRDATCGDTGKKIKPVTITKIKRFYPIILETLE